jgi:hypothetical protein
MKGSDHSVHDTQILYYQRKLAAAKEPPKPEPNAADRRFKDTAKMNTLERERARKKKLHGVAKTATSVSEGLDNDVNEAEGLEESPLRSEDKKVLLPYLINAVNTFRSNDEGPVGPHDAQDDDWQPTGWLVSMYE